MNFLCSINTHAFHRPNAVVVAGIIPSSVSANGLPLSYYPFTLDTYDYKNNSTGVNNGTPFGSGCVISSTGGYKGTYCLNEPTLTGGFTTNPVTYTANTAISFGGWFKVSATQGPLCFCYIQLVGGSKRYWLRYNSSTNNITFYHYGLGSSDSATQEGNIVSTAYTVGTWIHIIVVVPVSGGVYAYANNSLVSNLSTTSVCPTLNYTGAPTILFGFNGPGNSSSGSVNHFYIFNRELSASEVNALYNQ